MVTKGLPAAEPDRIYAIGDVHGHANLLRAIHHSIRLDLLDRPALRPLLVHLGDYIDRGPDSAECIAMLVAGSPIRGLPCVNLMGNHERMMLNALDQESEAALWLDNGGVAALQSWGVDPESPPRTWLAALPASHVAFLRTLRLAYRADPYFFVHAGVRPGVSLTLQSPLDLLWIRNGFLEWEGIMLPDEPALRIVHGHTPTLEPELRPNRLGIDTNAARGGKLTCAALSSDSVYFLQA